MIESTEMKMPAWQGIIYTAIFYACLWVVPDKKSAFAVSGIFFLFLTRQTRSIPLSLVWMFIAMLPISIGKLFPADLVSASRLHINGRPFGISAEVNLAVHDGLVLVMAGYLAFDKGLRVLMPSRKDALGRWLVVLPVALVTVSLLGSILPVISSAHALFYVEPLLIYMFFRAYAGILDRDLLIAIFLTSVGLECTLTLTQMFRGGTIGSTLEDFPEYIPVDFSAEADYTLRLGGTFPHANILAHYLLFCVPVLLAIVFDESSPVRNLALVVLLGGAIVLMGTLSRSSWLAAAVGVLVFFWLAEKRGKFVLRLPHIVRPLLYFFGPVAIVFAVLRVLPRISETLYTFTHYGSGMTRELLLSEALAVFSGHQLFGVGLEMGVYLMFQRALHSGSSVVSYFPEPVHNGFIRLIVETGIAGSLSYFIVLYLMGRSLWALAGHSEKRVRLLGAGIFAGFCAAVINAQLQPLLPNLQELVLLTMICQYVTSRRHVSYAKNH
jgi:hypothetical protein